MGICHQVNLEHLGRVVRVRDGVAMPDTLVGTDSHTTMVNGLGVLGWGVGGIEAEAAMLGQPMFLPWPIVVGVKLTGALPAGTTATDLVLTLTQMLRAHGVVGKFVEFYGDGLSSLTVEDRATLSNMCPEYGATASFFPADDQTVPYLRNTGRGDVVDLVERYTKEQGAVPDRRRPRPGVHRDARPRPRRGRTEHGRPPPPAGPRRAAQRVGVVPGGVPGVREGLRRRARRGGRGDVPGERPDRRPEGRRATSPRSASRGLAQVLPEIARRTNGVDHGAS